MFTLSYELEIRIDRWLTVQEKKNEIESKKADVQLAHELVLLGNIPDAKRVLEKHQRFTR